MVVVVWPGYRDKLHSCIFKKTDKITNEGMKGTRYNVNMMDNTETGGVA
jgi:hypothetical protein